MHYKLKAVYSYSNNNGMLYCTDEVIGGVFKYGKDLEHMESLTAYPGKRDGGYDIIFDIDKEIYMFPRSSNDDVYVYNIEKKEKTRIRIPFSSFKGVQKRITLGVCFQNGYLYCYSMRPDHLIRVNIKTKEFKIYDFSDIPGRQADEPGIYYPVKVKLSVLDNKLIIPCSRDNLVFFDTKREAFDVMDVKGLNLGRYYDDKRIEDVIIGSGLLSDNKVFFYSWCGKIFLSEIINDRIKEFGESALLVDVKAKRKNANIIGVISIGGEIWIFDVLQADIYITNIDGRVENLTNPYLTEDEEIRQYYSAVQKLDDKRILLSGYEKEGTEDVYLIETKTREINRIYHEAEIKKDNEVYKRIRDYLCLKDDLEVFMDIAKDGSEDIIRNKDEQSVGSVIYHDF